jgi:Flp pilus assembly protein protease CpaA
MEFLLLAAALAILAAASYTDIRTREVPDWLSYGGIAAGLGLRLVWSASLGSWEPLAAGVLGLAAFLGVAYALFYLGQWGGGDSKLLMGMGALLGLEPSLRGIINGPLLAFFTDLLIVGALYGALWSLVLGILNWSRVRRQLALTHRGTAVLRWTIIGIAGAVLILAFLAPAPLRLPLAALGLSTLVVGAAVILVKAVEQACMLRWVPPAALTEGDWIARPVRLKGRVIAGPKDLGVSLAQIAELRRLQRRGIVRKVLLKTGMPFVPCFLLAYLLVLLAGNAAFLLL